MAQILVRCSEAERERIKLKAESGKLSVSSYLLRKGLDDRRNRDGEDSTTLANLYGQLLELNQNLKAMPASEFQQKAGASLLRDAIALCKEVGREVVLYRLARQVEQHS